MTLSSLIARIEGLSGPCRELDAEIAVAISNDPGAWVVTESPESIFSHQSGWFCTSDDKSHSAAVYTASLDAAMTLVPEGWKLRQIAFSAPCADDRISTGGE